MKPTSLRWLYSGIAALAISGLYSIALVILRSPGLSSLLNKDLFRTALVIHVNLSVLVWLLSSSVALWVSCLDKKYDYWVNYSNYLALIGVLLMAAAPLIDDSNPVLNNYIPMLENWCFVTGLVVFGCAALMVGLITVVSFGLDLKASGELDRTRPSGLRPRETNTIPIASSAIIFLMAFACLIMSYYDIQQIEYPLDIHFYYETLFWSGGHILQFVYTQAAMVAWVMLSARDHYKSLTILSIINVLLTIPSLYAHMTWRVDNPEFIEFFTLHMKYCGGIAPGFLLVTFLFYSGSTRRSHKTPEILGSSPSKTNPALLPSTLLFIAGGVLGSLIHGINVIIPAHYHGSIVGISIAFMGLCYVTLQINTRLSLIQPWIYAIGQLMHIGGLAWSGGYGVLRKTPAAELSISAKISMGFMGFGGLVAIIGGLIFVWICSKKIFHKGCVNIN
jgi:cytochrome c oxidase subunit 1